MSITEVNLLNCERINGVTDYVNPRAEPADHKVKGGLALIHTVDELTLVRVKLKLSEIFDEVRSDHSNERGSCVAYGYELQPHVDREIDEVLVETAVEQNHGMRTHREFSNSHILWAGKEADRLFHLTKNIGPILFDDSSSTPGVVYCLSSHRIS